MTPLCTQKKTQKSFIFVRLLGVENSVVWVAARPCRCSLQRCVLARVTIDGTNDDLIRIDGVEKYTSTNADAGDLPANEASDDDDDEEEEEGREATCPRMRRATTTARKST